MPKKVILESIKPLPEDILYNHKGTVWKVALKICQYFRAQSHLEDLVQEGMIGLLRAWQTYNPENARGATFNTYAVHWIRHYTGKYIEKYFCCVRYDSSEESRQKFWGCRGRLDVSLQDHPGKSDGEGDRILEEVLTGYGSGRGSSGRLFVRDETGEERKELSPDELYERRDRIMRVRRVLRGMEKGLAPVELAILRERILSDSSIPLRVMAKRYGITKQAANQREKKLREKVEKRLKWAFGEEMKR